MTDLTKATCFLADKTGKKQQQQSNKQNTERGREKKPTFSVTTCQSKHQGSCSGEDFRPKTPRLFPPTPLRSLSLKRMGVTWGGGQVFGARSVLLLFCSKEVKLLIVEIAWRREDSHPLSEELHSIWAEAGRFHASSPGGAAAPAALAAVNGKVGGSPREGSTVP